MKTPARFIGAQAQGERHAACDEPCCDALWLPAGGRRREGFVICDGAGGTSSIAHGAAVGARAAWRALLAVRRELDRAAPDKPLLQPLQRRFRHAYLNARGDAPVVNHTVLACLWDRRMLLVAQVGDSSLLLRIRNQWQLALQPAKGEFANETTFLRPDTPTEAIALRWLPSREVEAVIGFSDGLEPAFLAPRPGAAEVLQPNSPLADLLISEHRQRQNWRGYPVWLKASLGAQALTELSDDDRTLVLAA